MEMLLKIAKFVHDGGVVEYSILGLFTLGIAMVVERIWFFWLRCRVDSTHLLNEIMALIRKGKASEARKLCLKKASPLSIILEAGVSKYEQAGSSQEIREAVDEASLREIPKLQRRIHYLGLLANLCTLIGLLGTIFGLQEAFSALESADPSQKSKMLAQGITLALNATALGLMTAMACMSAFTWLGSKSNQLLEQIDESSLRLVNFLTAQQKSRHAQGEAG